MNDSAYQNGTNGWYQTASQRFFGSSTTKHECSGDAFLNSELTLPLVGSAAYT